MGDDNGGNGAPSDDFRFSYRGVGLEGAGAVGMVEEALVVTIDQRGVTTEDPQHGTLRNVPWSQASAVTCGEPGVFADGSAAVTLLVAVGAHQMRWLIPPEQLSPTELSRLQRCVAAAVGQATVAPAVGEPAPPPSVAPAEAAASPVAWWPPEDGEPGAQATAPSGDAGAGEVDDDHDPWGLAAPHDEDGDGHPGGDAAGQPEADVDTPDPAAAAWAAPEPAAVAGDAPPVPEVGGPGGAAPEAGGAVPGAPPAEHAPDPGAPDPVVPAATPAPGTHAAELAAAAAFFSGAVPEDEGSEPPGGPAPPAAPTGGAQRRNRVLAAAGVLVVVVAVVVAVAMSGGSSPKSPSAASTTTAPSGAGGGGSTGGTTGGGTTGGASTGASGGSDGSAADRRLGASANLEQSDVPGGWTVDTAAKLFGSGGAGSVANGRAASILSTCLGIPSSEDPLSPTQPVKATVDSPVFEEPGPAELTTEIASSTQVFPTSAPVTQGFTVMGMPEFTHCFGETTSALLARSTGSLPPGTHLGTPQTSALTIEPVPGAKAVGLEIKVPVIAAAATYPIDLHVVFIGGGRLSTTLMGIAVGHPFPALVTAEAAYQIEKRVAAPGSGTST